jgi:DNA-binding NtrC family response regulator
MSAVWIVDDDQQSIRWVLERALTRGEQYAVHAAFRQRRRGPAWAGDERRAGGRKLVISDIRMPGESGIGIAAKRSRSRYPEPAR